MEQLLLHLFGDFIIQNDYVALNKKKNTLKGWLYCLWHCITYALPFLLITNLMAVIGIAVTHFIIDKSNVVVWFLKYRNFAPDVSNFGFLSERPFAVTIWLSIFMDNTLHLICNYLLIIYVS
jgi:hypothetical protein